MSTLEVSPLDKLKWSHQQGKVDVLYCSWCECLWPCDAYRLTRALEQAGKGLSVGSIWWDKAMKELEK